MSCLARIFGFVQNQLLPCIEEQIDPLTEKEQEFVRTVELAEIHRFIGPYASKRMGRKRADRLAIAHAFVAKAIYNLPTTDALIGYLRSSKNLRRLCGWERRCDLPSKATFSRAFDEFSRGELPGKVHEVMIRDKRGGKVAGHISRDSTAIVGREKPVKKKTAAKKPRRRKGRPRKGETRPAPELRRLEAQAARALKENMADLPTHCDRGSKVNSQGHQTAWNGYKLHLDVMDGDLPVSAILSSASLHDSQVAIPLAQMSAERVVNLYDLMDAAYDAERIREFSRRLGHVAIIDHNPRRGRKRPMPPAKAVRYRERSSAERVNSNLKDNYGGRFVRVRGATKVMAHLMFGVLALTATQLFRLLE
jgi:hypothetical protein